MSVTEEVRLLSETRFDHRVPEWLPKSNPTADLSVTWEAAGRNLMMYRPRDQVVSKIHQYSRPGTTAPEALALQWKPDGQFLAVGWSDGHVRLMGLENNKAAHNICVTEDESAKITHIGWACNIAGKPDPHIQPSHNTTSTTLQPAWHGTVSEDLGVSALDLPRELSFLEIDNSLPKLSPLPAGSAGEGEDALVFTMRTGIEFLFQPFKVESSDQVHVMVVGTSDGRLHLSLYDSFVLGDFRYTLPSSMHKPGVLRLFQHASHPAVSTHSLLLTHPADADHAVYLVPMDLPFIPSSPINLSLLASKLTTLQKLLRYLKQTQLHMNVEYRNTRDLPARFLRSVQEDLEKMEHGPKDVLQALFHTVVTGHVHEVVKEWLVDSLAERGHKRWDKAVSSGLENLRCLVHENFIPALNRCSIILSRLRGLAQFYSTRDDIGFSAPQISRALDVVSSLTMVGHRILLHVMEEVDLFTVFSTWLRFQIDRLASANSASEELTEKEALMDNGKVLAYIQRYLTASPMSVYFDEASKEDYDADFKVIEEGTELVETVDAQLQRQEHGRPHMKALPQVKFLLECLDKRSNGIFKDIAESQKRSVRFARPTKIVLEKKISKMDSVMGATSQKYAEGSSTFIAATQEETPDKVFIFRTIMSVTNGISSTTSHDIAAVQVPDCKCVDVKFLDQNHLILLVSDSSNKPTIWKVPVDSPQIAFHPYAEGNPLPTAQPLPETLAPEGYEVFSLPGDQGAFHPVQMEVHGATASRGEAPARLCLLGRDRATWRVFALEKPKPDAKETSKRSSKAKGKEKAAGGGHAG